MPNGNGSPKGKRNARSNHEVLATEREPEGPAQRAQQSVCYRLYYSLLFELRVAREDTIAVQADSHEVLPECFFCVFVGFLAKSFFFVTFAV